MKTIGLSINHGLMLMKDGKAWGIMYEDPYSVIEGFTDPINAYMYDPEKVKQIQDITNEHNSDLPEMLTGRLRLVEKTTKIKLVEEI